MIRKLQSKDRQQINAIIEKIDLFTQEEKKVAAELVHDALGKLEQNDYNVFVYEKEEKILGYHCTGKRALTNGVYDLYWIVVNPDSQNRGVGKTLLIHAEEFVQKNKGRWILAETSSAENYYYTRNFYLRNNFTILAEIKDFYSVGNNLIIFGKYLIK